MDIESLIYTDDELNVIDNGAWVELGEAMPGAEVYVTGMQSEKAQALILKKQMELIRKNPGRELTTDEHTRCSHEALVEEVLKDWRGITSNGEPLAYDKGLARKWLTTRNGARFAALVMAAAIRLDRNTKEFVEGVAKN